MKDKTLVYLTGTLVACIAVLLVVNFASFFMPHKEGKYIDVTNVRGMAIYHKNIPYTLNFDQQNTTLGILNNALPVSADTYPATGKEIDFQKLVIYQINKPDIVIQPLTTTRDQNLVFDVHEWNPKGYLKERSRGKLKKLLSNSYEQ